MKKITIISVVVIMLMSMIAFEALAIDLTVWAWGTYPSRLEQILPDFEAEHPDINVSIESVGWSDMNVKMLAAMAAGTGGPDLSIVNSGTHVTQFAHFGGLKDVTKYIEPVKDEYTQGALNGASYNGRFYAVPADVGPYVMFYRKDIFDEAGVDVSDIVTWQDYIEAGKIIKEKTGVPMVPWPREMYEISNWFWDSMMRMSGGNIFDKYGNVVLDKLKVNYTVLETMKDIDNAEIGLNVIPWKAPWNIALKEAKVATVLAGAWFQGSLQDVAPETSGKWRMAPAPTFVEGAAGPFGGSSWIIPVFKSDEVTEAAVTFARFASASNKGVLTKGVIPSWKPIYEEDFFKQPSEFFGGQKVWEVISEVADNELATFNITIYTNQVFGNPDSTINYNVSLVLNGQKTIEEALRDAANDTRKIMNQ